MYIIANYSFDTYYAKIMSIIYQGLVCVVLLMS